MNTPKDGEGNMDSQDQSRAASVASLSVLTPGPWEVRSPTLVYGNLQRDQNSSADLVASTVSAADARLIAAAPDLLEACQRLERVINAPDTPAAVDLFQAVSRTQAAIAKALGQ